MNTIPETLARAAQWHQAGHFAAAEGAYRQVLQADPRRAEAWNLLGILTCQTGRPDEAVAHLRRAIELNPGVAAYHYNLGLACQQVRRPDEALGCYQRALQLQPQHADAAYNLGCLLAERGELPEAEVWLRRAVQVSPERADAWNRLGMAAAQTGRPDEAVDHFRRAIELDPGVPAYHFHLGLAWLTTGDFARGWPAYERRCQAEGGTDWAAILPQPRWAGTAGERDTVLLLGEQGLGDTLQFIRYARLVRERCRTVCFLSPQALVPILSRTPGIDRLITQLTSAPPFDAYAPLLSVPGMLGTRLETIPADVPYLFADPELVAQWRRRMLDIPGFRIGIHWREKSGAGPWSVRDLPLSLFSTLAAVPNVRLISLQQEATGEELGQVRNAFSLTAFGDDLDGAHGAFMDTAAIMMNLDLVITSDTAVAHLAGGLGVPVWVALPLVPDWRWLLHRSDSPWYPTMRLFRQPRLSDWASVFGEIGQALRELVDRGPSAPGAATQDSRRGPVSAAAAGAASGRDSASAAPAARVGRGLLGPAETDLLVRQAWEHFGAGDLQQAEGLARQILAAAPEDASGWQLLGAAEYRQGHWDAAAACCRRVLDLDPQDAETHNNLGAVLKQQGQLEQATACFQRALELQPTYADALVNLGATFQEQGRADEAMTAYHRVLELRPDHLEVLAALAWLQFRQGQFDEALRSLERSLHFAPDDAQTHFDRAWIWLLQGDLERGWPEYEWRVRQADFPHRGTPQTPWDGAPLEGRTILVFTEQGLGDTLQFVRYLPLVKQRGGTTILECQEQLVPLLRRSPGIDQLVPQGQTLPRSDTQVALLSLPNIFGTRLDNIPASIPYLQADEKLVERWRAVLAKYEEFKIGVHWQTKTEQVWGRSRSIPLEHFAGLAHLPGVRLFSLQKSLGLPGGQAVGPGPADGDAGKAPFPLVDFGKELDEASGRFMDTAAIMQSLDLVICEDTSLAHLAGGLGVPVWVALPFVPDWRWLLHRSDSPWYPTMRLFRQPRPGDWESVFGEIERALRELVKRGRSAPSAARL